jgi:spore germination cell wall hydrolase CwlJ-like protein
MGGQRGGNKFSYLTLGALSKRRSGRLAAVKNTLAFKGLQELLSWRGRELACSLLLFASASCVPGNAAVAPVALGEAPVPARSAPGPAPAAAAALEPMVLEAVSPTDAAAINAAIPLTSGPNPAAPALAFRGAAPLDQLRSLQCLAEAVYYEARSESEDGQRAVAQVVLNRVRHPAYPSSVCGVVYQGPMRAGGGCQFTFTCDGSLAIAPYGGGWLQARRIAAAALAGSVYAPVGLATHYHTQQVLPVWAYRLAKTTLIGNHIFYRMPGAWGAPGAFTARYAGREPSPATIIATRLPISLGRVAAAAPPPLPLSRLPESPLIVTAEQAVSQPRIDDRLPESGVRPEFANSGRWIADGAAAASR